MYNINSPSLRGNNVSADQASYDLVFKDFIINNKLGTTNSDGSFSYNLSNDSINQIYKAELISATVAFNNSIPTDIQNASLILSIPQLNNNTVRIAGNTTSINTVFNTVFNPATNSYIQVAVAATNSNQGSNTVQTQIFCQIPDNNTALNHVPASTNYNISLIIGPHMYDSIQFYNPPINRINHINVLWYDQLGKNYPIASSGTDTINSFYFTLRIHYFQKRNGTTAFSTSVVTNAGTGTLDSIFRPLNS